ncbi:MAG: hypothetical protein AAGI30_04275 [Planctomycetota bacterium]
MPRRAFIIKTARGRLGNKLLPVIAIEAMCLELGATLTNLTLGGDAAHFNRFTPDIGSRPIDRLAWRLHRWAQLSGVVGTTVKASNGHPFVHLPPTADDAHVRLARWPLFFIGHRFYNPIGVHAHHAALVGRLRPVDSISARVASFAADLPRDRLAVALHIRQGDFAEYKDGLLHTPLDRYRDATHAFADRFADLTPQFHVFSNIEIDPAILPGLDLIVHHGEPVEDLFRIASCDLVISTASTFGLCAALLGNTCLYALNTHFHDALMPNGTTPRHSASTLDEVEAYLSRANPIGARAELDSPAIARAVIA